jgi:arginyl-tRNA synthetase
MDRLGRDEGVYHNDGGGQIQQTRPSVRARLIEQSTGHLEILEGGYHGRTSGEIAAEYAKAHPDDQRGENLEQIRTFAVQTLREEQDRDLKALGIRFDVLPGVIAVHGRQRRRDRQDAQ